MSQARYQVGGKVCVLGQSEKAGVVIRPPQERRGTHYYQVFFSAQDSDGQYPEQGS